MQTVKVKDIKVKTGTVASGKNEGNPWELIIIIGEDGSEFTTFDTAIKEVGIGGTLELEAVIKKGKANITKFTIIQKGSAAPAPGPNGKPDMSKEDWSEKDRLERWSRECNTCFMGIMGAADKGLGGAYSENFGEVFEAALAWALKHFNGTPAPAPRYKEKDGVITAEKPATTADADFDKLVSGSEFKNVGEFLTRVTKELGITSTAICEQLGVKDVKEIADYKAAYELLKENADKQG